ncbi:uncharacterized protein TNCV_3212581 [Trichonephila clavipes]|nr:uncharacterized protein TNCV_3212581 [Trichonephila clavipes]
MDASSISVGAVLNQEHRQVVFASCTLSAAELNYTVTEREFLALNEREHRAGTQNAVADVLSRNPVESIIGEKVNCAIIRYLLLSSREQLTEEQKTDPELGHIYRYLENPEDGSVNATICENWFRDIRRRRDVQIKVNDWVLVATPPLSSATRKVVTKFKPKFEGPYRVLDVKNNNIGIWKAGKRLTVNVDHVRIYRHKKCDKMEIRTGCSDSNSSRHEASSFESVQRRSNESQYGKTDKRGPLIRSPPSSWTEPRRKFKISKKETLGYKRSHGSRSGRPERKQRKGQINQGEKRQLTINSNSELHGPRKKYRGDEGGIPNTSKYNLRPRKGKRVESRPIMEMKTQQGGPVRARKSKGRNYNPYIEEQTRSSNKNTRRRGNQQQKDQDRKEATNTSRTISLEVLVGDTNYMS